MHLYFRKSNRRHFGSRIELHGAATKGNHGSVQSNVLGLQISHISHETAFGVDRVEHFLSHILVVSLEIFGEVRHGVISDFYLGLESELS